MVISSIDDACFFFSFQANQLLIFQPFQHRDRREVPFNYTGLQRQKPPLALPSGAGWSGSPLAVSRGPESAHAPTARQEINHEPEDGQLEDEDEQFDDETDPESLSPSVSQSPSSPSP